MYECEYRHVNVNLCVSCACTLNVQQKLIIIRIYNQVFYIELVCDDEELIAENIKVRTILGGHNPLPL